MLIFSFVRNNFKLVPSQVRKNKSITCHYQSFFSSKKQKAILKSTKTFFFEINGKLKVKKSTKTKKKKRKIMSKIKEKFKRKMKNRKNLGKILNENKKKVYVKNKEITWQI